MRLFIAIDLSEELRERIVHETNSIKTKGVDVAFTSPENLHITLKFLGEVSEKQFERLKEDFSSTLSGFKQFDVNIKGMGYFGSPDFMKVIWMGLHEGKDDVVNIINSLNTTLDYIRTEDFEPNPHITLGRVKTGKNKHVLLHEVESKKNLEIGKMVVKSVKIKQSELTGEGPIYSDLLTISLKG